MFVRAGAGLEEDFVCDSKCESRRGVMVRSPASATRGRGRGVVTDRGRDSVRIMVKARVGVTWDLTRIGRGSTR